MKKIHRSLFAFIFAMLTFSIPCLSALADDEGYFQRFWDKMGSDRVHKTVVPGYTGMVDAAFKTTSGKLELIGIGCLGVENPAAVAAVRNLIDGAQPLPLPTTMEPYVWIAIAFEDGKWNGSSGPYPTKKIQEEVRLATGLQKKTYENQMEDKLCQFDLRRYPQCKDMIKTVAHVKLAGDGKIAGITISAPEASSQKFVYDLLARSHPFGSLPAQYKKSPNFDVKVEWQYSNGNGMRRVTVKHAD